MPGVPVLPGRMGVVLLVSSGQCRTDPGVDIQYEPIYKNE
jgi:hypothetical protein